MKRFNAGESVVYDTYGICMVEKIEKKSFCSGMPLQEYYVLSVMGSPNSTYYVPLSSEKLCSKLRYPLSVNDIHSLLKASSETECEWIENRQMRADTFHDIMQKGVSAELVALIRCMYEKKCTNQNCGKKLSATDESLFNAAQKLLTQEFAFSLGIEEHQVCDYIGNFFDELKR